MKIQVIDKNGNTRILSEEELKYSYCDRDKFYIKSQENQKIKEQSR